jgi:hypothetical protein
MSESTTYSSGSSTSATWRTRPVFISSTFRLRTTTGQATSPQNLHTGGPRRKARQVISNDDYYTNGPTSDWSEPRKLVHLE